MIDAEYLVFGEDFVQLGIECHGAGEVGAERLFHDDAALLDESGFLEEMHRGESGFGRHAQIMHPPAVAAERLLRRFDRLLEGRGAGGERDISQGLGEGRPVGLAHLAGGELIERRAGEFAESFCVESIERHADDPAAGDEARCAEMEKPGQQLAPRQIARGADENEDLRIFRTDP